MSGDLPESFYALGHKFVQRMMGNDYWSEDGGLHVTWLHPKWAGFVSTGGPAPYEPDVGVFANSPQEAAELLIGSRIARAREMLAYYTRGGNE